jgi:hypothetical protein
MVATMIPSVDPYVTSVHWSHRFLGLRLFPSLAAAGWAGYSAHVERAVALTALLADQLRSRGWTIANASPVAVLCFPPPSGSASVADNANRIVSCGKAWILSPSLGTTPCCITHGHAH